MLSILIPTYDFNVYPLVLSLQKQAKKAKVIFEIICIDDGSLSLLNKENEKVNSLENCKFIAKKVNVGLSNNRNALANISNYELLLFIDGDSLLPDEQFIERFIEAIGSNTDVVYGGRIHPKTVDHDKRLRWKYGRKREDLNASERNKNTYKCIMFNNALIKKSIFDNIGFEKTITQYGYEDTVFAYKLYQMHVSVMHIDNPVLHNDVDFNEVFLKKTQKAIENLNSIYRTKIIDPDFMTFLKIFNRIELFKLHYPLFTLYKFFNKFFKWQLTSKRPSLLVFDLFRLSYFCNIYLKK